MIVAGIDLGKKGAVAFYDTKVRDVTAYHKLPLNDEGELDSPCFLNLMLDVDPKAAVMEQVFRPNSVVKFWGAALAVCQILGCSPIEQAAVVTWKKAMLGEKTGDKSISIRVCEATIPFLSTVPTMPSTGSGKKKSTVKTKDDNIAEAALLAKWLGDRLDPL